MTEIEILTADERLAAALAPTQRPDATVSVAALTELLRAAADLERAQRPIVIHTSSVPAQAGGNLPQASAVGYAPPRHPGVDITVPAAPEPAWATLRHRAPQRPGWGLRLVYAGMAATLAGAATAGATDGNAGAVASAAAGLLAVIGGIAQAVNEHSKGV